MKLVMAIIHDEDAHRLMDVLNENGFSVTKLASTGGFLRSGNTTILIGTENEKVELATTLIEKTCKSRKQMIAANTSSVTVSEGYMPYPIEVSVGGATIFVIDVENFKKV